MIKGLGASIFVHNAIEYDYCLGETVASIASICEEIVILDAQSTDGTIHLINNLSNKYPNVKAYYGAVWECANNYMRLQMLAIEAKNKLSENIKWHFMIQADEVLHETSEAGIKAAIDQGNKTQIQSFRVRRYHVYGDFEHMVSLTAPQNRKPAGDCIIRLGKKNLSVVGDAENLEDIQCTDRFANKIILFHYGYMRHSAQMLKKGIDMTNWFGGCIEPDKRLIDMRDTGRGWKPYEIMGPELLEPIRSPHPVIMENWIDARKNWYPPI